MPQLHADFVRDGGTYMILQTQGEGFHPDLLNHVERSMLTAVSVPRLLKLDVREIDFEIRLHFDITGKRMLAHCLRSDPISLTEFYGLLLQVAAVLEEGKRYMLKPANFILDEQHIFVENPLSWGTLHFTYVPWRHRTDGLPLAQALLGLMTRLLTCVAQVEGQGIPQLVKLCGDESFSLSGFKDLLLELLAGGPPVKEGIEAAHRPDKVNGEGRVALESEKGRYLSDRRERASSSGSSSSSSSLNYTSAAAGSTVIKEYITPKEVKLGGRMRPNDSDAVVASGLDWPGVSEDEPTKLRLKPTYLLLGAILAAALCWKLIYIDQPGQLGLYICGVITALLAVIVYWGWRKKLAVGVPETGEERGDVQFIPLADADLSLFSPVSAGSDKDYEGAISKGEASPRASLYIDGADPSEPANSVSSVWHEDESKAVEPLISPPTMLLSRSMLAEQHGGESLPSSPHFYLERSVLGGIETASERIPLSTGSFVIGRSEELVQFVENSTGVSRAHVEVMVSLQGCTLKDLGSTNGTRLKGEVIAPYKAYPLEAGDVFSLAEVDFKLVIQSRQ